MIFSNKKSRPFQISCGLLPGYIASDNQYTLEDATKCIGSWMSKRVQEDKKIAVGTILAGTFVYPMENSKGYQTEDSFQYRGIIREDTSDEEAEEMLKDLAQTLATTLKQKRVHIQYCDAYWILNN
jgi:hypothetical protein